jgi:hypothetical protein
MLHQIRSKRFRLAGTTIALLFVLAATIILTVQLLRGGLIFFGEDYRGQPANSFLGLAVGWFAVAFFILLIRKIIREEDRHKYLGHEKVTRSGHHQ